MRSADAHWFAEQIQRIRSKPRYRVFDESLHWKRLSKAKVDLYKELIDEFLYWNSERRVDFNCIYLERSRIQHRKYNESDPEKGFFKFLYQHHHTHCQRFRYGPRSTFRCYHGNMETGYDIAELKRCLNSGTPKSGLVIHHPYRVVDFMKVKRTHCLQISDILIGAVGYILNGKAETSPDSYRTDVARHLERNCPARSLGEGTPWPDFGFAIWDFPLGA